MNQIHKMEKRKAPISCWVTLEGWSRSNYSWGLPTDGPASDLLSSLEQLFSFMQMASIVLGGVRAEVTSYLPGGESWVWGLKSASFLGMEQWVI